MVDRFPLAGSRHSSLVVLPSLVARHFGARAALLSGLIMALAPFLIFHSRLARPYAPLLLLEFLAFTHLGRWSNGARRSRAIGAVVLGALAIWVHVTAFAPLWQPGQRPPCCKDASADWDRVQGGLSWLG